jgi:type III restriction enzyme
MKQMDKLIINSPYEKSRHFWEDIRDTRKFILQEGRRPAGYIVASVTMVGARSLVVAQVCANDTSRDNTSKPIFISDTIEI